MNRNDVNAMLLEYAQKDYSELVSIAKNSINTLYPVFVEISTPDNSKTSDDELKQKAQDLLFAFVIMGYSLDNELGKVELHFLRDIVAGTPLDDYMTKDWEFDWNDAEDDLVRDLNGIVASITKDPGLDEDIDALFDAINVDAFQEPVIKLMVAICAVDKNISIDEIKYLHRLID